MADESEVALGGEVLEDELVGAVVEDEVVLLLVVPHLPGSSVPLCASNVAVCRHDISSFSRKQQQSDFTTHLPRELQEPGVAKASVRMRARIGAQSQTHHEPSPQNNSYIYRLRCSPV